MSLSEKEAKVLLGTLCVKLGFCLPANVSNRLIKFPPKTAVKFSEAVVKAEGLTSDTMDKKLYKSIVKEVEGVFEQCIAECHMPETINKQGVKID